jgi:hypothetical protein
MSYLIKGFRQFKGHEGEPCAQGNLYKGSRKVAEWSDDSWGGSMLIRFETKADEAEFGVFARGYLAPKKDYDEQPFDLSKYSDFGLLERAVSELSYEYQVTQDLKRRCKKGVLFYEVEKGERVLYTLKVAYTAANVEKIKARYPGCVEIVNETLGLPYSA